MTAYDKKEEESGKLTYAIPSRGANNADFTSEMVDEKGKLVSRGAGKYKCAGGVKWNNLAHFVKKIIDLDGQ